MCAFCSSVRSFVNSLFRRVIQRDLLFVVHVPKIKVKDTLIARLSVYLSPVRKCDQYEWSQVNIDTNTIFCSPNFEVKYIIVTYVCFSGRNYVKNYKDRFTKTSITRVFESPLRFPIVNHEAVFTKFINARRLFIACTCPKIFKRGCTTAVPTTIYNPPFPSQSPTLN